MPLQTILWIALPGGFVDDARTRVRLSVFVSPQLRPDGDTTLAPFDFAAWPEHVAPENLEFDVSFGDTIVKARGAATPKLGLWRALFRPQTFVRAQQAVMISPVFGTYPLARVHDLLRAGYQHVGMNSPIEVASTPAITAAFADVRRNAGSRPARERVDPNSTEREQRALLASDLLHPELRDAKAALGDQLVDMAFLEAGRRRANGAPPEFVPIVPSRDDAASPFEQFIAYHQQSRGSTRRTLASTADARLDFHQWLTSLGEYPGLLRLLGLIIDLEIDVADVPQSLLDAPLMVRAVPKFATPLSVSTLHVTPATAYAFQPGNHFIAASDPAAAGPRDAVAGLLDLRLPIAPGSQAAQFRIVQVDVDGGSMRTLDLLGGAASGGGRDHARLPPLRSGGVSIAREGQAELLHEAIATGFMKVGKLLAGIDVPLFAEDVTRGYRIDVQDTATGEWRSLHQRKGTYTFTGAPEETIVDEGCIQPCSAQPLSDAGEPVSTSHDPSSPNYMSESLFLWNNYSLSAPRPGVQLAQPPPPPPATPAEKEAAAKAAATAAASQLPLDTVFSAVPRTLPRLRFGKSYGFRARMVDLAGQSLSVDDATKTLATLTPSPVLPRPGEEFKFLRFEVVGAPVLVPRSKPQEGESLDRIVVRDAQPPSAQQERHIAPPKTFQLMAEMFGLFDSAMATDRNFKETFDLASREQGSFDDGEHPEAQLQIPYLPDPLAAGVTLRGLPGLLPGTIGRVRDGRLEFTPTPLPQATAAEVGSLVLIDFGADMVGQQPLPFRLRLAGGAEVPRWDAGERVLTVFLPPGETSNVRIACHLRDEKDLSLLGIVKWMEEGLIPQNGNENGDVAAFKQRTLLGLSWMVTPYRELTLVHAVQQPVEAPEIVSFPTPIKLINQTFANIRGNVRVHGPSTGRLELIADWMETADDHDQRGHASKPEQRRREAHVFPSPFHLSKAPAADRVGMVGATSSIPEAVFHAATDTVEYLAPKIEEFDAALHRLSAELKVAKASLVQVTRALRPRHTVLEGVVGVIHVDPVDEIIQVSPLLSRWSEVIDRAQAVRDEIKQIIDDSIAGPFPGEPPQFAIGPIPIKVQIRLDDLDSIAKEIILKVQEALRGVYRGRHEFGDTKHRRINYRAVATSRFSDAFPAPLPGVALDLTRTSPPVTVDVLSSAAPNPPGIQCVIPAFRWTRSNQPNATIQQSRRQGGGLRVYLDRPWFSSGEGELLAVVLGPHPSVAGFDKMEPFVTQWGRDPLWRSPPTTEMLLPENFRNASVVLANVRPQEPDAPSTVTLIGYPVDYDAGGRCFCDIELDFGESYCPFVRLALARFQPQSVPSVEMSRVIRADFAQLAPDRAVTVVTRSPGLFGLTVAGHTHDSPTDPLVSTGQTGTQIRVSVQARIPGTTDDAGWIPAGAAAVVSPETAAASGDLLWQGEISLPAGTTRGEFRALIEELEMHQELQRDGLRSVPRVVFAETVEL